MADPMATRRTNGARLAALEVLFGEMSHAIADLQERLDAKERVLPQIPLPTHIPTNPEPDMELIEKLRRLINGSPASGHRETLAPPRPAFDPDTHYGHIGQSDE